MHGNIRRTRFEDETSISFSGNSSIRYSDCLYGDSSAPADTKKHTNLGKYMTAQESYEAWRTNPKDVTILDVRTPEEYVYVGMRLWRSTSRFLCGLANGCGEKRRNALRES